jgi:hypothetical protein
MSSLLSILLFAIPTIGLYFVKPKLTIQTIENNEAYLSYEKTKNLYLLIYFVLVVFIQFGINCSLIISKCGGSTASNIGAAGLLTFVPWLLIFGLVMCILIIFPGFKSAFSNVIGYFIVASSANKILTELLVNTEVEKAIDNDKEAKTNIQKKEELEGAASAIVKLCGNMSVLINQIVPSNFSDYWKMLHPLMKPSYQNDDTPSTQEIKQQLLDVVVVRDSIGELLWYIYSAVLLIFITQYSIVSRACVKDPAAINASLQEFNQSQQQINEENAKASSSVYTI